MRLVPLLSLGALTLALSGCSLLGFGGDDSQPAPVHTPTEPAAEVDKVVTALEPLIGDEATVPSTKKFFKTMIDAGYDADQLEATIDDSPLGNDVPSKMFGVKTDNGCVVGEIRKGKATAELMPPTESTGSCLLGEVERPKGVKAPEGDKREEDGDSNGAGHMPGEDINGKDGPSESPAEADGGAEESSSEGTSSEGSSSAGGSAEGSSSGEAPSLGGG
ncbi:MAG: hypothetical protein L0I80_00720 [Brevibacterium sp.]|uniref:DUF6993 domain-containing protein n=1 Tax=Brevibacterium sp. TaxID=1701 RepID=UPI0026475428|nr:hypothetical protein [Brevibacterium sp.]MDN5805712.1 hypothetical protein [Brevibacterium sp.]MDN5832823.1 hypothetical protein [Brevibacterium sp.]MDN5875342.1 hypothetical protein [Brevibacterium sp.]MDN5908060.1 hypothetical protein [Brevibacterium sp.]MDN6122380.1 hypothetical protein [Brevibacterium sp.]